MNIEISAIARKGSVIPSTPQSNLKKSDLQLAKLYRDVVPWGLKQKAEANAVRSEILDAFHNFRATVYNAFKRALEDSQEHRWAGQNLSQTTPQEWKEIFKKTNYFFQTKLTDADLTGMKFPVGTILTESNLSGANLTGVNLEAARFNRADLTGANLTGANLTGANLINANLAGAKLIGANLRGASLTGANLAGAFLSLKTLGVRTIEEAEAILKEANAVNYHLINWEKNPSTNPSSVETGVGNREFQRIDGSGHRYSGRDLSGENIDNLESILKSGVSYFFQANWKGLNLTSANFPVGAVLREGNFNGVNFSGATLIGVDLSKANLTGANFEHARLINASLEGADLTGSNLKNTLLAGADFTGATLQPETLGAQTKEQAIAILNKAGAVNYHLINWS